MSTLLTGGRGRLGSELLKHLPKNVLAPSSKELDITDRSKVFDFFKANKVKLVIHTAAMTDVCACETEPDKAMRTNVIGVINLFDACRANKAKLVYISTDHIFDGKKGGYKEDATPNPFCVYAHTKFLGEKITLLNPKNLVIRTSFIKSFELPRAFKDKFFSGDTVDVVAKDILLAVKSNLESTWHIGGPRVSIYDVAKKLKPDVQPMKLKENPINKVGLAYLKDVSLNVNRWRKFKKSLK
jgi:dTDP-4-dehydrorhamnose reductase